MPVSLTAMESGTGEAPGCGEWQEMVTPPECVNLMALPTQVDQDLADTRGIAEQDRNRLLGRLQFERQLAGPGHRVQSLDDAAQQVGKREGDLLQPDLAGLDARVVEDVVEDGQQAFRGGADGLGVLLLPRRQAGFAQQVGHAHNAVHRCADLVAHGGQEAGLGDRGGFGGLSCKLQLAGGFALG